MAKTEKKKKEAEAPPVDGEEGAEGEAKPKKKFPILIVAIAAGVLVLGGGGAAAYFLFLAPKHPPAAGAKDAKAEHGDKKDKKKDEKKDGKKEGAAKVDPATQPVVSEGPNGVTYVALPEMVSNIQSPDGNHYLKLQLTLECGDDDTVDLVQSSLPRINDIMQGFMSELRPDDLTGGAGDMQLRLEILRRVNLVLAPHKINAVLITQKVMT